MDEKGRHLFDGLFISGVTSFGLFSTNVIISSMNTGLVTHFDNIMKFAAFIETIGLDTCPDGLNSYQRALWYEARGDWDKSHEIVQNLSDRKAARIHAYLHRVEGDLWNSGYWHRLAGSQLDESLSLKQEWLLLAKQVSSGE